jgi:hypothetical protein
MKKDALLHCRCREVRGILAGASPRTANRVVCYCDDCQAFLHHLGRADLLDANAVTDIVQVAPASMSFTHGRERIAGLRLAPKGIFRWYASCCNTPLGNTVGPSIPFVGLVVQLLDGETQGADELVGPRRGGIFGKHAVGRAPPGTTGFNPRLIARSVRMVLGWRLSGQAWPHPFFDRATRAPKFAVTTLADRERERLRGLCGPRPVSPAPRRKDGLGGA